MLHRLRSLGLSTRVLEAGDGLGGTWFWNRYPGARCDIPSLEYSYQFSEELQQEWQWTERYATQPEILKYLNFVADKFDLKKDIQLNTRVETAAFQDAQNAWSVRTNDGETLRCRYFILATGPLSSPYIPNIKGLDQFSGRILRTSTWPKEKADFTGRRVGIIGTGSSGLQAIPVIAEQAKSLTVFQRTAAYSVPANNYPLSPVAQQKIKADYTSLRKRARENFFGVDQVSPTQSAMEVPPEERAAKYEEGWNAGGFAFMFSFYDLVLNQESNDTAADFVRGKIKQIVRNPKVAEALFPKQAIACKRMCVDIGYYETFNRSNVTLINLQSSPISEITDRGLRTMDQEFEFDDLILATGFDSITGPILKIDIRGHDGAELKEKWAKGAATYLGLSSAGFPNLFMINGPGSPSVLANMVTAIEHHAEWISKCIETATAAGNSRIEATTQAESAWTEHVAAVSSATLFPSCNSSYLGANIPGKPRVFLPYAGGFPAYLQKCTEFASNGYEGFSFSQPSSHRGEADGSRRQKHNDLFVENK